MPHSSKLSLLDMLWLSRHMFAYLIAAMSVLSLLSEGQFKPSAQVVESSWCPEDGMPLVDAAVLDAATSPLDRQERESEDDSETNLFTPLRDALQSGAFSASAGELFVQGPALPKGRTPILSIYRPPRA